MCKGSELTCATPSVTWLLRDLQRWRGSRVYVVGSSRSLGIERVETWVSLN